MTETWENRRRKTKNYGIIAVVIVIVLFICILVINNFNIFLSKKGDENVAAADKVTKVKEEVKKDIKKTIQKDTEEETIQKEPPKTVSTDENDKETANSQEKELLFVELPTINCFLAGKKSLTIDVSLKLYFKGKELEKEILFKRDNIKVLVKKVFLKKHLSEVVADALRTELKKEINATLEQGKITDIEFINFSPVE